MDESETRLVPLSALQHLLYCERQCALIHLERVWVDNRLTAEGNALHEKVHEDTGEVRQGVQMARGLPVASESLGLIGQCDVVEFHSAAPTSGKRGRRRAPSSLPWTAVIPVEYKRGRPKSHDADRVQLCAQALCLEEMLGISVAEGALFYGEPRRRTQVTFTPALREMTKIASIRLHALLEGMVTPSADYQASLCRGCSLLSICLPRRRKRPMLVARWFEASLAQMLEDE